MSKTLNDKVALVTGGASGIGRASALALAAAGAKVVVADLDADQGAVTLQMIADAGGEARFIRTDVSRGADIQAAVACAVDNFGRLDIAHNNAGILAAKSILSDDAEALFDQVMAINTKSVMLSMKYEIAQMLTNGGGAIINTASTMGLVGAKGQWAYSASKHAVLGLTKSIGVEFASQGIRVNAVCPGAVHTPMLAHTLSNPVAEEHTCKLHPIGRVAEAGEIAAAVVWLASDAASYMVGAALTLDGGYTAV